MNKTDEIHDQLKLALGLLRELDATLERGRTGQDVLAPFRRAQALVEDAAARVLGLPDLPGDERPREAALVARFTDPDEFLDELARALGDGRALHGPVRITKRQERGVPASSGLARVRVLAGALLDDDVLVRLETLPVGDVGWTAEKDEETWRRADAVVDHLDAGCGRLSLPTAAGVYLWAGENP